jgi:hypothetical protein
MQQNIGRDRPGLRRKRWHGSTAHDLIRIKERADAMPHIPN